MTSVNFYYGDGFESLLIDFEALRVYFSDVSKFACDVDYCNLNFGEIA